MQKYLYIFSYFFHCSLMDDDDARHSPTTMHGQGHGRWNTCAFCIKSLFLFWDKIV